MNVTDLVTWILNDFSRYSGDGHIDIVEQTPDKIRLKLYTDVNEYSMVAHNQQSGGYLGAQGGSRKPRAGETWTRGNDLADGPFSKDTWERIKNDIISFELVRLRRQIKTGSTPNLTGD